MKLESVQMFIEKMGGLKELPKEYLIEILIEHPSLGMDNKKIVKSLPWSEQDLEKFRKVCFYLTPEDFTKIKQGIFIKKMKK